MLLSHLSPWDYGFGTPRGPSWVPKSCRPTLGWHQAWPRAEKMQSPSESPIRMIVPYQQGFYSSVHTIQGRPGLMLVNFARAVELEPVEL